MDRDSVPAIIFIVAISLAGIITWILSGPSAASDGCYLQAHPRHMVEPMHSSPLALPPNNQHCVGR